MRRATFIFALLLTTILLDTAVIPRFIIGSARPNLTLIFVSVWVALDAPYSYVWAFIAGILLDGLSAMPTGTFTFGLLAGNLVARVIEAAPIPVEWFRVTVWVALVTVIAHSIWIAIMTLTSQPVDLNYAARSVILPALLVNPLISIPVYVALSRFLRGRGERR